MTTDHSHGHARVPNTLEWLAKTKRGDYLVQVAWPLCWGEDRVASENEVVNLVYLVDGNAYFFTAVDVSRRLEYLNSTRTVVVGIGYPPSKYVYDFRRGPDLTPPADEYDMPLDRYGKPRTDISFGEANEFLDWIKADVMPYVEDKLFPKANLHTGRKALFGHSYGGIFTLNTMFTQPELFHTYIAASPVIWWNKDFLIRERETAFLARDKPVDPPFSLALTWGTGKSELVRDPDDDDEKWYKRQNCAEDDKMKPSATALVSRLKDCPSVKKIWTREFEGEDHGSVAVTGLQQGLMQFILGKI
ncbi:ferri-bacillibactin esterase [Fusarium pseudocircinatum]|uniref:Ferri-bacillibactin esterase n=1 Tax=Fusarium pseudocircinatum TaxID=56676 RepID=A0A8H5P4Q3_9HYPO|nr:ferri-bacillibactin esterase [Fusarium pseudocircinatum]